MLARFGVEDGSNYEIYGKVHSREEAALRTGHQT